MIPEVRIRIWTESGLASIDRQGGSTLKEGDQKTFSIFFLPEHFQKDVYKI